MRKALIITAVGNDRPGIVDRLSGVVYRERCNLEDSRMAILGGSFALIVLVTGPAEAIARLERSMPSIETELGLTIVLQSTGLRETQAERSPPMVPYRITAVALDHPGIVHRISNLLALNGINVASLDTRLTYAPITGSPVFSLTLEAEVPAELPLSKLRLLLEKLAGEENLDLEIKAIR
jgi:glycine cleavage system transcriptional repressor